MYCNGCGTKIMFWSKINEITVGVEDGWVDLTLHHKCYVSLITGIALNRNNPEGVLNFGQDR